MPRKRKKSEKDKWYCPLTGDDCVGDECQLWDGYYQRCLIASALIAIKFLGKEGKKKNA